MAKALDPHDSPAEGRGDRFCWHVCARNHGIDRRWQAWNGKHCVKHDRRSI